MTTKERIAVLGATGVYGRHLLPRLAADGYRVRALVRKPEAATIATACGAELAATDIFDEASLRAGLVGCDVAINLATSLPRRVRAAATTRGTISFGGKGRRTGCARVVQRACRASFSKASR